MVFGDVLAFLPRRRGVWRVDEAYRFLHLPPLVISTRNVCKFGCIPGCARNVGMVHQIIHDLRTFIWYKCNKKILRQLISLVFSVSRLTILFLVCY